MKIVKSQKQCLKQFAEHISLVSKVWDPWAWKIAGLQRFGVQPIYIDY